MTLIMFWSSPEVEMKGERTNLMENLFTVQLNESDQDQPSEFHLQWENASFMQPSIKDYIKELNQFCSREVIVI